ncbi:unnamed protein product [Ceutorhynchus assimilis]|uniref:CRAL-TRIO domain-containing protein n=1 Tax=Ceutorhynchus assimilis TaxID=467358 RepID=A0A9P0GNT2_9CUCU|nr:unnamed protein product [Ceutorhynchus assimilis]
MTELNFSIDEELFYKQVYSDYGKTKEDTAAYVDILKKWVVTQKHLPETPPEKAMIFVLMVTKFSIEKAKKNIDMYYTIRGLIPEMFSKHPSSPEMILQSKIIYVVPLPKPTANLQRIIYVSINPDYAAEKFDHATLDAQFNNVIELLIQEDRCYNFHVIYDVLNAKMAHIPRFSPMQVKKMIIVLEKVYSNRVASISVVNFHPFLETVANNLFVPFLSSKLKRRLKFYNNSEILLEIFGKSWMPKDIGGEEKSLAELTAMEALKLEINEDKLYSKVYEEFQKTKEDVLEYINLIQEWCKLQAHWPEMPSINGTRFSIVSCKFSIEKAKEKLEMYYTIRRLMPEVFATHPLSPEILKHSKVIYCIPLPKITNSVHRVIYVQVNPEYGSEHFSSHLFFVQLTHVIEVCLQEDSCYNFEMVLDFIGAKLSHAQKISPMVLKKMAIVLEKVYANRNAAIYLVNMHSFVENVLNNVCKPLLPKKISERMKALSNIEDLQNFISKSILPKDVGGEEHSLAELQVMMTKKFQEFKPRFDKIQFMTVDESKRPEKLINDDILGFYGSFRQINVD